eukprot:15894975-Heterocapsa_arctica.AAC.1
MPTGRYRKGDWICGRCRHSNFARGGKMWCQKCPGHITEGLHAYGDDTLNAAQQQWFLSPRNVEATRPRVITSELYKGSGKGATEELPKLVGWTQTTDPEAEDINAAAENHRYRMDQSDQWRRTGAMVWDGFQNPCNCKAFVHAHYHEKAGRHQEGERCLPDQAIPFWERILEEGSQNYAEEDAKAAAEESKAREEVWQCEEAKSFNVG